MMQRLYVHNFRCLENFELDVKDMPSALLIGKNGTVNQPLLLIRDTSAHRSRRKQSWKLCRAKDFARGRSDVPIRFEIEVLLGQEII